MPDRARQQRPSWRWWWQGPDYGHLLPALARLPSAWGLWLAGWRGRWHAVANRDWVELSVGEPYIAQRTRQVWANLRPDASEEVLSRWVSGRYQTLSQEEWLAARLAAGRSPDGVGCSERMRSDACRPRAGCGVVWLQAHFHSPLLGCVALARATGRPLWVTMSSITEDSRVHPAVAALFRNKYAAAARWLNGGGFVDSEKPADIRRLYRALERGEDVVVMADLPAAPGQPGVCVPWLGGRRVLAGGAVRLSLRTGAPVGWVSLHPAESGGWRLDGGLPDSADEAYAALAALLKGEPSAWWAAHLWLDTGCCEEKSGERDG